MIDLHCHLLPGLDDGAKTVEDALLMARQAAAGGVKEVVCTPHQFDGLHEVSRAAIEAGVQAMREALAREGIGLVLHAGADVRLDERLFDALRRGELQTVAGGPYLLLEFPHDLVPADAERFIFQLALDGVKCVLTHPERNRELMGSLDRVASLAGRGVAVQVTAGSILGEFGPEPRRAALALLERGLVHVVATDAHSPTWRAPCLRRAHRALCGLVGEGAAWTMVQTNPARIVAGEPVLPARAAPPGRAPATPVARPRGW